MLSALTPIHVDPSRAVVVVPPSGDGPGWWAGSASALLVDGTVWLAYRLRRPVGQGRGFANVVARSDDGVTFEAVAGLDAARFGAESLERPALAVTDDGRWRLYVSCATPGTKHWRIDLVEADTPEGLSDAPAQTVLPGSELVGVKDPVVLRRGDGWHMWVTCHPLSDPEATDRMTSEYATSPDGVEWTLHGPVLLPRPGFWDSRGTRITAVVDWTRPAVMLYDGRASAQENWEERTGFALALPGSSGLFGSTAVEAVGDSPIGESPYGVGGLRYASAVQLPDGTTRLYYEMTRADGAHDLCTQLVERTTS